jgi:hypothetical protein
MEASCAKLWAEKHENALGTMGLPQVIKAVKDKHVDIQIVILSHFLLVAWENGSMARWDRLQVAKKLQSVFGIGVIHQVDRLLLQEGVPFSLEAVLREVEEAKEVARLEKRIKVLQRKVDSLPSGRR